jgi:hypothetical protein
MLNTLAIRLVIGAALWLIIVHPILMKGLDAMEIVSKALGG